MARRARAVATCVFVLAGWWLAAAAPARASDHYEIGLRYGMSAFQYQLSDTTGSVSTSVIDNSYDLVLGNSSSIGIDIGLGISFSEKLFKSSQMSLIYKYFPFTYAGKMVGGDAESSVKVESAFYPYLGGGLGYSTLVVKDSEGLSATAQFVHFLGVLGGEIPVSGPWSASIQGWATYGAAGTGSLSIRTVGFAAAAGVLFAF